MKGLECGDYYITETKAPDGYLRLTAPLKTSISDENGDGAVDGNTKPSGFSFVQVQNTRGFVLPATGGMGTVAFIAVGAILVGSGAIAFAAARKRTKLDSEE